MIVAISLDVIVNTDSGVANQRKNAMQLAIASLRQSAFVLATFHNF
jgi:hypothetical protein